MDRLTYGGKRNQVSLREPDYPPLQRTKQARGTRPRRGTLATHETAGGKTTYNKHLVESPWTGAAKRWNGVWNHLWNHFWNQCWTGVWNGFWTNVSSSAVMRKSPPERRSEDSPLKKKKLL